MFWSLHCKACNVLQMDFAIAKQSTPVSHRQIVTHLGLATGLNRSLVIAFSACFAWHPCSRCADVQQCSMRCDSFDVMFLGTG